MRQPAEEEQKACKMCEAQNGSGCTQMYSPDPKHWICEGWLNKAILDNLQYVCPKCGSNWYEPIEAELPEREVKDENHHRFPK